LSNHSEDDEQAPFHYEGETPIFDVPSEREDRREKAHAEKDDEYKNRQTALMEKQLSLGGQNLATQCALVLFGLIGIGVSSWQAHSAKVSADAAQVSADAAKSASDTAAKTLLEAQRGDADQARANARARNDAKQAAESSNRLTMRSLQAAIDNFQQEQRPWIGLQNFTCSNCKLERIEPRQLLHPPSETFSVGQLSGLIANTGKTPAVQVEFNAVITTRRAKDPIPNWDSIQKESLQRIPIEDREQIIEAEREASPPAVMPPSYAQWYPLIQRFGATRERTSPRDSERIYAVGKITYLDVRRKTLYVTTFCLVDIWWASGESSFQFCSEGNDMK
jgi:hypothetical protein